MQGVHFHHEMISSGMQDSTDLTNFGRYAAALRNVRGPGASTLLSESSDCDDMLGLGGIRPDAVLVAIPTLNEAVHIEACLRSLIGRDDFCKEVRVAIVDGGSSDDTCKIVSSLRREFANIHLIDNPDRVQSAAINKAVRDLARPGSRYLIRCDAHALYPNGYIRRVIQAFAQHPDADSIVGVLDAGGRNCFQRASAWLIDTPLGSGGSAHRGGTRSGWVKHGHHAGFRLDWFQRLGGYDPTFTHNEDAEYDHRLITSGGRIWLDGDLRIDYVMRPTPKALWLQYWRYGKGRARTTRKHEVRLQWRQATPALSLVAQLAALLMAPVWPASLALPALYLFALATASGVAMAKMRSLCGLWAGVAAFIIHNAWALGFICGKPFGKARVR